MRTKILMVTPQLAEQLLKLNTRNRNAQKRLVNLYADDMLHGRWKLNAETIKVGKTFLVDGQQRLLACVKAGVSFPSLVAFDVNDDVFDTVDRGGARTLGQILGIKKVKNAALVAGALRCLFHLETGITFVGGAGASIGNLEGILSEYPELEFYAAEAKGLRMLTKLASPAIICGLWVHFSRIDKETADAFFHDLNDETSIFEQAKKLRQRLFADSLDKKKIPNREELLVLFIKTWNAVRTGKQLKNLRWAYGEERPKAK
jgi:hypothetical protein